MATRGLDRAWCRCYSWLTAIRDDVSYARDE